VPVGPVTPSAELDHARLFGRLAPWIAEHLSRDGPVDGPARLEGLPGPASGNSNVTMPFVARWRVAGEPRQTDLVLRMQVPSNKIFLDTDVLREYHVLAALDNVAAVPSPSPYWAESDPAVLGQPFFVMERVSGLVPSGTPSIHTTGWLSQCTPAEARTAWDSALTTIAAIHDVDWHRVAPFLAQATNGTTLEQRLDHLAKWYEWAVAGREFPITDAALRYLRSELRGSDPGAPVLLWGDPRMGNFMFTADHHVAAALDWELASIGPAAVDLGWWLAMDEFQTAAHGVTPVDGYPGRDETIARYQALTGREVDHLRCYEILCAFVLTVTVIRMADIGVAAGRLSSDNRMGQGNLTAQMLARWLDLPVPELDPAYAARRGLAATT
jgi:aminoglycoside phosphotransferase (APT) family kinase protein